MLKDLVPGDFAGKKSYSNSHKIRIIVTIGERSPQGTTLPVDLLRSRHVFLTTLCPRILTAGSTTTVPYIDCLSSLNSPLKARFPKHHCKFFHALSYRPLSTLIHCPPARCCDAGSVFGRFSLFLTRFLFASNLFPGRVEQGKTRQIYSLDGNSWSLRSTKYS